MSVTKTQYVTLDSGETVNTDSFGGTVISSVVAVRDFKMSYSSTDHNIQGIEVTCNVENTGTTSDVVAVTGTCEIWDHSSHTATGTMTITVIAEVDIDS